jgi:hypothetical protein
MDDLLYYCLNDWCRVNRFERGEAEICPNCAISGTPASLVDGLHS